MSSAVLPDVRESTRAFHARACIDNRRQRDLEHIRGLDGLRGVAVMMVMALHVFKANNQTPSRVINFIYALIHSGWMGVDLFFVLSGFLITRILYSTQRDPRYLKNFYARRFLRIFPLYYGVIAVLVALEPFLHLHLWRALPYYLTYTANLRPSGPIRFYDVPGNAIVISHFWSLQIEEQFYLVWPFVLALLRTRWNIVAGAAVGCAGAFALRCYFVIHAAHFANEYWAYAFTPCRIDSLLIGGTLAMLWFSNAKAKLIQWAPLTFSLCVLVLAADGVVRREFEPIGDPFLLTIGFTLVAVAGAALIVLVLSRDFFRKKFEGNVLCWLGRYSYGIYVFHFIWIYFLMETLRRHIVAVSHSKGLTVVISGLVLMVITILTAYTSYELYEKKLLRLKRYFAYKEDVPFEQPAF
jgi:peptidoglycan/LPS O-acetylase OafA/YrhL